MRQLRVQPKGTSGWVDCHVSVLLCRSWGVDLCVAQVGASTANLGKGRQFSKEVAVDEASFFLPNSLTTCIRCVAQARFLALLLLLVLVPIIPTSPSICYQTPRGKAACFGTLWVVVLFS